MEGLFHSEKGAPWSSSASPTEKPDHRQPHRRQRRPQLPHLRHHEAAEVKGLDQIPRDQWPTTLPLLFYSYHIMAGLGNLVPAAHGRRRLPALARQTLHRALDPLAHPAQLSAALHRQHRRLDDRRNRPPALARLRPHAHREGYSIHVGAGNSLFTLLGFLGMYAVLSILWIVLVYRFIAPARPPPHRASRANEPAYADDSLEEENMMGFIWFWIVAVMLVAYVVLDGFDLGVGILYSVPRRVEDERRTLIRSIGPVWDGNEVWLLAGGGTLYFAFPLLYASPSAASICRS
jgi:hypothetical protein